MRVTRMPSTVPAPAALLLALTATSCSGGAGSAGPGTAPAYRASDAEWLVLATPRPSPLAGAPRVAVSGFEVLGTPAWTPPSGLDASLGLAELVVAGLLRRRDVDFVERRRFVAAVDAERTGLRRPEGAPAAGVSRGAQYLTRATWSSVGPATRLDIVIDAAESGATVARWRMRTPPDADAVSLARLALAGTLAALDSLGVRPTWQDPAGVVPGAGYEPSGVSPTATAAFFRGLAAEEEWRWEEARRGYQDALSSGGAGFVEAAAALARAARLRNGGTLGASW